MTEPIENGGDDLLLLGHRALLRDAYENRGLVETAWVRLLNEVSDTRRDPAYRSRAAALARALLEKLVQQRPERLAK